MPVSLTPWCIDGNTHPAADARRAMAGILGCDLATSFAGGVGAVDAGHGVVRSGDLAVAQNGTPNMSVLVAAGSAFIRGTQAASQGVYHSFNDASTNLTIAAANATNPRRDLIVLQIRDAAYSGAVRDARLLVVTGTPAASPVDPSLSSTPNALVLARVRVAAAATSITNAVIDDLRTTIPAVRRFAVPGSGLSGVSALTTIATLSVPAQSKSGYLQMHAHVRLDATDSSGQWEVLLMDGATVLGKSFLLGANYYMVHVQADRAIPAGTATTTLLRVQRVGGAGTIQVYADATVNRLDATFIPD
jgi:hypothetical protein